MNLLNFNILVTISLGLFSTQLSSQTKNPSIAMKGRQFEPSVTYNQALRVIKKNCNSHMTLVIESIPLPHLTIIGDYHTPSIMFNSSSYSCSNDLDVKVLTKSFSHFHNRIVLIERTSKKPILIIYKTREFNRLENILESIYSKSEVVLKRKKDSDASYKDEQDYTHQVLSKWLK